MSDTSEMNCGEMAAGDDELSGSVTPVMSVKVCVWVCVCVGGCLCVSGVHTVYYVRDICITLTWV